MVNEAAFLAARRGADAVVLPDLLEAVSRTRWVLRRAHPTWGVSHLRIGASCLTRTMPTRPPHARYGVNGGASSPPLAALQKRLQGWLVDAASSRQRVRASTYGN